MGNVVATLLWDPSPNDQKIITELTALTKKLSLAEAEPNIRAYKEGKTIYGAENAGLWRTVISDTQVDKFSVEGAKILKKYGIADFQVKKQTLTM